MNQLTFGTDGYRGEFNTAAETGINAPTFEALTYHFANQVAETEGETPTFVVGCDTRESGPRLSHAVVQGALAAGAEVWDVGIAPTPVIAWIARTYGINAVSITASHNPARYNGFKPFLRGGDKLGDEVIDELTRRYELNPRPVISATGEAHRRSELFSEYLAHVIDKLGGSDVLGGYRLAVDGANGATHSLAPRLYRGLGAEVTEFACSTIGSLINADCGAEHLGGAVAFLASNPELTSSPNFLGLLSHDGDGDRVMALDAGGNKIDGNYWMYNLSEDQRGIVGTVYTNTAARLAIERNGVEFIECGNGDSKVTAKLVKLTRERGPGYKRGGEFSGHLVDLDHLSSGDGMYMGAWMAVKAVEEGTNFAGIRSELELFPERMEGIPLNGHGSAADLLGSDVALAAKAEADEIVGKSGRVIVRASGTEPLIRVWAEAEDSQDLNAAVDKVLASIV